MEACTTPSNNKIYTHSNLSYEAWQEEKLEELFKLIEKQLQSIDNPTVIVLEIAHFSLPLEVENRQWATRNMKFANALCERIIKKHHAQYKIIPTLLLNNLDDNSTQISDDFIEELVKGQKYIRKESVRLISERNLKNRAFKALKKNKKLAEIFINIDGKAYLKNDDYKHDLAAGFINEDGKIIPRCGLILTSYLDTVAKFANDRLHTKSDTHVLFVSFSEEYHEYQRVRLGTDIYTRTHKEAIIHPIVMHWDYKIDECLTSFRECNTQEWHEVEL